MRHLDQEIKKPDTSEPTSLARWVLALITAALLIPGTASGQETPKPEAKSEQHAPTDLAILLVEISRRAEQTTQILNEAMNAIPPDESIADVTEQIPEIEKSLSKRRSELERTLASGQNRRRLADY